MAAGSLALPIDLKTPGALRKGRVSSWRSPEKNKKLRQLPFVTWIDSPKWSSHV